LTTVSVAGWGKDHDRALEIIKERVSKQSMKDLFRQLEGLTEIDAWHDHGDVSY
jgi:hypothetical protein